MAGLSAKWRTLGIDVDWEDVRRAFEVAEIDPWCGMPHDVSVFPELSLDPDDEAWVIIDSIKVLCNRRELDEACRLHRWALDIARLVLDSHRALAGETLVEALQVRRGRG